MDGSRLEKLMVAVRGGGLDAVALNPGPTLTYLTGLRFHLMERPVVLLVAPGKDPVIVLPELETPKVNQLPYKVTAVSYGENPADWDAAFRRAVLALQLDGKRIGVEFILCTGRLTMLIGVALLQAWATMRSGITMTFGKNLCSWMKMDLAIIAWFQG